MDYSRLDKFLKSGDTLKQVQAEAQRQREIQAKQYAARQKAIIEMNKENNDGLINGIGRRKMSIDRNAYLQWCAVDPHFWEDHANLRKLRMTNPEIFTS